jgi:murein tripeptide amidase MpaA
VSYHNEAVVRCSKNINLERHMPVTFDVWKEDSISNDIKMKKTTAKALVEIFPEECSVIIPDLEKHVVLAEAEMIDDKQKVNPWQYWVCVVCSVVIGTLRSVASIVIIITCIYMYIYIQEVTSQDVDDPMSEDWFKKYHNYESIKTFYKTLAENNRELVTYVPSIGQSVEGRDMIALHITASKSPERLKYYIQCQIHAREWISGATCQYLAKKLVESYTTDHKVKNLLDQLEFVMVPVVNPDGYEYTWKQNRLWRKNRSYNEGSSCRGVDLNRNFEKGWGVVKHI